VLDELLERSGLLRQPQHGTIDFVHRTFLEYMAARGAIRQGDFGVLVERARDESWRETIVFSAGHAQGQARDRLINDLLKKRSWLKSRPVEAEVTAACCLETVGRSVDPALLTRLRDLARRLFPPQDFATAALLAPAAAIEPELLVGHGERGEKIVAACIRTAAMVGGKRMLEVIGGYAAVGGGIVDLEIARAWDAFDDDAFAAAVVRPRGSLFGIPFAGYGIEASICLRLLIALGQHHGKPSEAMLNWVNAFRDKHELTLREFEEVTESTRRGTHLKFDLFSMSFRLGSEARISRRVPKTIRRENGRLLAQLRSLEELYLPTVEPDVVPMLAELSKLRSLSFSLDASTDLSPLSRLQALETVMLTGPGVTDVRQLAGCSRLRSLTLARCGTSDPVHVPMTPSLFELNLEYLPTDSIELLSPGPQLQALRLAGLKALVGESLKRFPELRELEIRYCTRVDRLPFAELEHLKHLTLQGVTNDALRGLESAKSLLELNVALMPFDESHRITAWPPMLETLRLHGVASVDFGNIAHISNLHVLSLHDVRSAIAESLLTEFRKLRYLFVAKCGFHFSTALKTALEERGVHVNIAEPASPALTSEAPSTDST
jgi:hypothetical protein